MPVHGPTALQAKLKLEGRSVLTCGSLGRCRSVGAVMLTSLELGEMVTAQIESEALTALCPRIPRTPSRRAHQQAACVSTAAPPKRDAEKVGFFNVL